MGLEIDWKELESAKAEQPSEETKAEEQPKQEEVQQPQAEEQPTNESPSSEQEQPKEEAPQENEEVQSLKQKLQEYESKLEEFNNKPSTDSVFVDDEVRNYNEWKKQNPNETLETFFKYNSLSLDKDVSAKGDALELVRLELEEKKPHLKKDQIDRLIKKNYGALFDDSIEPEDQEYKDALIDLQIGAEEAKNYLAEKKSKYEYKPTDPKDIQEQERLQKEALQQFHKEVETKVHSYQSEPIKVGETEVNFQPTKEQKQFIEHSIKNSDQFFNRYLKGEGNERKIDYDSLNRDMLKIVAFDDMLKVAIDQATSSAKEEFVTKELKNSTTTTKNQRSTQQPMSLKEALAEGMANSLKKR